MTLLNSMWHRTWSTCCAASTTMTSGAASCPAGLSMVRAISSWSLGGRRMASTVLSRSLGMPEGRGAVAARAQAVRRTTIFPSHSQLDASFQDPAAKIIRFHFSENHVSLPPSRLVQRAYASSRYVRWAAMDVDAAPDERLCRGRRSRVVPASRC